MYDLAIIWAWLEFAVRWTHVVTAIAWIGSSFYFIALDLGLNRNIEGPADGEEWQVHGGGFYHIRKYLVAPEAMPEHLTWFKWESYATWLSGAALLAVVYWAGAELYLIDAAKWDLAPWQAIALSALSLAIGWVVYDALCKSALGRHPTVLMLLLFVVLTVMAWAYTQVFTGRASLLHLGAFTATIMTANVFLIIMPNQRIVVADLKAGRVPDAKYGRIAKLRSTHNNYLTLPVVFLMLSTHYPLAFATQWNWAIASLVFLMGVTIRHFFNSMHARKGRPHWTWGATAMIFVAIMWLSSQGPEQTRAIDADTSDGTAAQADTALSQTARVALGSPDFSVVADVVRGRCSMCHSTEPFWPGFHWAPNGVILERDEDIARRAREIFLQAGISSAMPPGNVSFMTEEERRRISEWYRGLNL